MIQGRMRCGTSAHILGIGVENHGCEDDETLEMCRVLEWCWRVVERNQSMGYPGSLIVTSCWWISNRHNLAHGPWNLVIRQPEWGVNDVSLGIHGVLSDSPVECCRNFRFTQGLAQQITLTRDWMWRYMWNIMSSYHPIMHLDDLVSILGHPQVVGLDRLMSKICFCSSSKSWIAPSQHTTFIFPPSMPPFIFCLGMLPGRYLVIPCEPAMPEQTRSQWRLATKSRSWQKCNTSATVKRGTCAHLQMKYWIRRTCLLQKINHVAHTHYYLGDEKFHKITTPTQSYLEYYQVMLKLVYS